MKILIIGGTGMLGHKLFQKISAVYPETYCTVRSDLSHPPFSQIPLFKSDKVLTDVDVTDFEKLGAVINQLQPDFILNCVGIIKQRKGELLAVPCITLNALLPHKLVEFASEYGGRVIHFSTDCVFDGKEGMYTEESEPNALDLYGKTKAMGEIDYENGLTLRSSIIGRELVGHASLLDWFLSQSGQSVNGFTHAIYSGVTTNQMAKVVLMIIAEQPELRGLYQVVADPINKFDLLALMKEQFKLPVELSPSDSFYMDRSMNGSKFEAATGYRSPAWPELIKDLESETELYTSWGINL